MKIFWVTLIFSLIYHLLQFLGIYWLGNDYLKARQKPEIIEIDLAQNLAQEPVEEKPIIKSPDVTQKPVDAINKPADLFAETTRRFKQQMQAQKKGVFQNKAQAVPQPLPSKKFEFENSVNSSDEFARNNSTNQWTFKSGETSQFEYNLPKEIPYGQVTVLDTDTHIYASFYNRVVDLFYIRWVQRLDSIWSRLSFETKKQLSGHVWLTEVEIILNAEGVYQTGRLRAQSGFPLFDQAVLYAFQSAQVFPNPPRGKIDPDGKVRLKYRVAVQVN